MECSSLAAPEMPIYRDKSIFIGKTFLLELSLSQQGRINQPTITLNDIFVSALEHFKPKNTLHSYNANIITTVPITTAL